MEKLELLNRGLLLTKEEWQQLGGQRLKEIARQTKAISESLLEREPSDQMCLQNGIVDNSYHVHSGWVECYEGEIIIKHRGRTWRCTGVAHGGDAWHASDGYIRKVPVE